MFVCVCVDESLNKFEQWGACRAGQCLHGSVGEAETAGSELHLAFS
jgi:hypothetical protein